MPSGQGSKSRDAVTVDDLSRRRLWLLIEALKCAPLPEALGIARAAEAFLAGEAIEPAVLDDSANEDWWNDDEAPGEAIPARIVFRHLH